jgi:hypothetical protein
MRHEGVQSGPASGVLLVGRGILAAATMVVVAVTTIDVDLHAVLVIVARLMRLIG